MKIEEIVRLLEADVVFMPENFDRDIQYISASDLMSDVLTRTARTKLLLTGLNTPQIIRTSSILDISAVIVVRGKEPRSETITLAEESNIPLLKTKKSLFTSSGLLYKAGLRSSEDGLENET